MHSHMLENISEAECILAFRPEGTLFQAYQAPGLVPFTWETSKDPVP